MFNSPQSGHLEATRLSPFNTSNVMVYAIRRIRRLVAADSDPRATRHRQNRNLYAPQNLHAWRSRTDRTLAPGSRPPPRFELRLGYAFAGLLRCPAGLPVGMQKTVQQKRFRKVDGGRKTGSGFLMCLIYEANVEVIKHLSSGCIT
jgi:hypothetical protein